MPTSCRLLDSAELPPTAGVEKHCRWMPAHVRVICLCCCCCVCVYVCVYARAFVCVCVYVDGVVVRQRGQGMQHHVPCTRGCCAEATNVLDDRLRLCACQACTGRSSTTPPLIRRHHHTDPIQTSRSPASPIKPKIQPMSASAKNAHSADLIWRPADAMAAAGKRAASSAVCAAGCLLVVEAAVVASGGGC